jgi:ABC-2 type transport system permease protein
VIALSLIYFILGYLLFAILMAGMGAIAPTAQMGQQLSAIFSMTAAILLPDGLYHRKTATI